MKHNIIVLFQQTENYIKSNFSQAMTTKIRKKKIPGAINDLAKSDHINWLM